MVLLFPFHFPSSFSHLLIAQKHCTVCFLHQKMIDIKLALSSTLAKQSV
jgi:hypothetical protein